MDLLHPDSSHRALSNQEKSQSLSAPRKFKVDDRLYARNYQGTKKWIPVKVTKITGPVSYQVETESGIVLRRHVDQLRIRHPPDNPISATESVDDCWLLPRVESNDSNPSSSPSVPSEVVQPSSVTPAATSDPAPVRRSVRDRRPVQRYSPSLQT